MSRENVLILTPGFPKDNFDDQCIPFLQDYVLALAETIGKDNIAVISFQYPFTAGVYRWNEIRVYSAGGKNRSGIFKWLTWQRVISKAKEWIEPGKTILHAFWLNEAALVGERLGIKYNCRLIATIMGQDILPKNKYLKKIAFKTVTVVAPNAKAAGVFQRLTGNDVFAVIRPGVCLFPLARRERTIDLLFTGSFIALKQPHIFIEIVSRLNAKYPRLQCVMIGDGPLKIGCIQTARQLQIANIRFTGSIPRKQVIAYMQQSKILVHPALYEGHATVFEEAIAAGMQVVCFDVGRPEHTAVHPCTSPADMCSNISALLDDYTPSESSYGIEQTVNLYRRAYRQLTTCEK